MNMRKVAHLLIAALALIISITSVTLAQWKVVWNDWIVEDKSPVDLLKRIQYMANDEVDGQVQVTPLNKVSSSNGYCSDISVDKTFTITRTFCSIKNYIKWYLQYIVFIWLVAATIFIIRNWFRIVTAPDKEAYMKDFKKHITYIIIWVILLTSFYFILEAFVSVVNFIAGD